MESMQGDHPAMPALIVTNQPNAGVIQQAERFGVACEMIDHKPYAGDRTAFETEIQNRLIPYQIDMICLAGFMRVLTAGFTDHWSGRMLNIHPSLLPKYKGLNTHARAIATIGSERSAAQKFNKKRFPLGRDHRTAEIAKLAFLWSNRSGKQNS